MNLKITNQKRLNSLNELYKYQIVNYCLNKDIWLTKNNVDALIHIAINGYNKNTNQEIVDKKIYKSKQCVINFRGDMLKIGLLLESDKKKYVINPDLELSKGNILFELRLLYVDKKE